MRSRISALLVGTAILTATLTAGPAAAAEPVKPEPAKKAQYVKAAGPSKAVEFPSRYPYTARVYTGNIVGASSTANKWMSLYGSDRNARNLRLGNRHVQNDISWVNYSMDGYLGMIRQVCVYRDNAGSEPEWYLGSVQVNGTRSAEFYRWIPAGRWECQTTQANP